MRRNKRGCRARWSGIPLALALAGLAFPALAGVAEIVALSGKGEFRPDTSVNWSEARLKQSLDPGNYVRTGDFSSMGLLFVDKTQMRLSQNSMFQVKAFDSASQTATINLRQGRAWTQTKSPGAAAPAATGGGVKPWTQSDAPGRLIMETPSATAAIHGTDWEMEVDAEGRARLTVLHGEVEFYNEFGRVFVRRDEQALAERGKAPVKVFLQNPAERVQWVTAYTVDTRRYPELQAGGEAPEAQALRGLARLIDEGRLPEARLALQAAPAAALRGALPALLAEFAIYSGELNQAEETLRQGLQRYPDEARLAALQVRIALLRDDAAAAHRLLQAALARHPASAELQLVAGELARFSGQGRAAAKAYTMATDMAPGDARGWLGRGVVESERENRRLARPLLDQARALDPRAAGTLGELATLETFANRLDVARSHFDQALREHPEDYVALTGRGLLQLKSGQPEEALDTLLRANVIEPRYARAVLYTAVAYYQLGRHRVALDTLARASELDRNDPLPHQLASLMLSDLVRPSAAIDEAREALRLMPYLKSLNQLANDQKGAANLGNALAQFGLEDWALSYAQQSYNPFWAGSHLFLADRYSGRLPKQSELMQGYLTDPTAFGAANRFQTLLPRPGSYFSAGATASQSPYATINAPSFIANGYANSHFPVAWFAEGMRINWAPGKTQTAANGDNLTLALGLQPHEDVGVFLFGNAFNSQGKDRNNALFPTLTETRIYRLDLGFSVRHGPDGQTWLKFGTGGETGNQFKPDHTANLYLDRRYDYRPQNDDVQLRHTVRGEAGHEWTFGSEWSRARRDDRDLALYLWGPDGSLVTRRQTAIDDNDQGRLFYTIGHLRLHDTLLVEAGVFRQSFAKQVTEATASTARSGVTSTSSLNHRYTRQAAFPRLGVAYTREPGEVWRLAWQKWLRPAADNSLAPMATAGVVLDDQTVLPDGQQRRWRFQFEREWSADTFVSLFHDDQRIRNLGEPNAVVNQAVGAIADLDRLRNRAALVFQANGEALEEAPVFQQGRLRASGVTVNRRLDSTLSAYASVVLRASENTHPVLRGLKIPYMPDRQTTLGLTWAGVERLIVQAAAIYRGERFADEQNLKRLPATWNLSLKANWQSADKTWQVEGYALNLLKKDTSPMVGINVVWKY